MWLVNWLIDQWDKLNLLFTQLWNELVNLASYGLGRLQSWVKAWIDWLQELLYYYVGQLGAAIDGARNWLLGLIQSTAGALSASLRSARDWLYGLIVNLAKDASAALTASRDWLLGVIQSVRNTLEVGIASLGAWVGANLTALGAWVNAVYGQLLGEIKGIGQWVNANVLAPLVGLSQALAAFRSKWEPLLLGLFSSPGRFIFGFIETYVYSWAEWFLAFLLGGVLVAAPAKRDFFHSDPGPGATYSLYPNLPDPVFVAPLPGPLEVLHPFRIAEPFVVLGARPNDTVVAIAPGLVVSTGYDPSNLGYHLTLDLGNRFVARYAYLDVLYVGRGDRVETQQPLGAAGNSGAAPGLSLRLELFYLAGALDPLRFVGA